MATASRIQPHHTTDKETTRPFSLSLYLLIVFALSWPPQFAFALFAESTFARVTLSSLSMVMVAVGTFIAGRYVFRDGFANMGWRWGKPKHYLAVSGLVLLIWVVPTLIEFAFGLRTDVTSVPVVGILAAFAVNFVILLLPAFSEEFGWRAYMLRHLAKQHTVRRALLLHAFIWWAWHIPAIIGMGLALEGAEGGAALAIGFMLLISLIPAMMHAVVFAYIWSATQSLAVATVYHAAFDEVRDAIDHNIGFGPLVDLWQMLLLTVLGAALLWKAGWRRLAAEKDE